MAIAKKHYLLKYYCFFNKYFNYSISYFIFNNLFYQLSQSEAKLIIINILLYIFCLQLIFIDIYMIYMLLY
jgi:hypothetical protein